MVSSALTFWIFFCLWMYSFQFSFRCAVVGFWCTFSFSVCMDNESFVRKFWLRVEFVSDFQGLPVGWSVYFGVYFNFGFVYVCFWVLFGCFVGFFPSSAFILLNLWLFIIKDFLPFPAPFPCALGRASSMGILQMILYTHHVVQCYIIYIKACQ